MKIYIIYCKVKTLQNSIILFTLFIGYETIVMCVHVQHTHTHVHTHRKSWNVYTLTCFTLLIFWWTHMCYLTFLSEPANISSIFHHAYILSLK